MKEITRIITAQITLIEQMPERDADAILEAKEEATANVKRALEQLCCPDDVTVNIQDFVRDNMQDKIKE